MISPADLAADAESLHTHSASGARCRSVISRAYYAAYHACDLRAKSVGYVFSHKLKLGTHKQLFNFMRSCADIKLRKVQPRLNGLYTKRISADYRLEGKVGLHMAEEALEEMTEIIEALTV